jgi:tetratricopeptide (TPR) repeat protein
MGSPSKRFVQGDEVMRTHAITAAILLACSTASSALAQLEPAPQVKEPSPSERRAAALATESTQAVLGENPKHALELAEAAIEADPSGPWGYYLRGNALTLIGRTADAVAAFADAEQRFADRDDAWGKSVAIWGAGNAYEEVSRCKEAATFYERYAAFVAPLDGAAAAFARERAKKNCAPPAPPRFSPNQIESANAETAGDYPRALQHAEAAIRENATDGFGPLMRGDALVSLRRYDEAVASYQEAERRFAAADPHGASLAIWGQARALWESGRCKDASPIYQRYAAFVEKTDASGAAIARKYVQMCSGAGR